MSLPLSIAILMFTGLLLCSTTLFASYGGMSDEQVPALAVPRMPHPPTIDGRIDASHWRSAAAIAGVVEQSQNLLIPRPTTFYLGWDDQHLYLAARIWLMPDYGKPRVAGRTPNSANLYDDGLELVLTPDPQNIRPGEPDSAFKFNLNALGFAGELTRVTLGQLMRNWDPNLDAATFVHPQGEAPGGGTWLDIELAVPVADLGLARNNQPDDTWLIMLGTNNIGPVMFARIPGNSGYFDPQGHMRVVLAEDIPAVQQRMDQLPGDGPILGAMSWSVFNGTAQPHDIQLHVQVSADDNDAASPLFTMEKAATLDPSQTIEFAPDLDALPAIDDRLTVEATVSDGKRELLRYTAFESAQDRSAHFDAKPGDESFPLTVRYDPVNQTLLIEADAYYLDAPERVRSLTFEITDTAGESIQAGEIRQAMNNRFADLIPLPTLAPGSYTVTATLSVDGQSKALVEQQTIEKLDEAQVFGRWWQRGVGDVQRVLEPFKPIQVEDDMIHVWGRSYRLNASGLPTAIMSQDGPVLASPARLVARIDGESHTLEPVGRLRITESTPWRVAFEGQAQGGGIAVKTRGWIEQDGLLFWDLSYGPADQTPIGIDAFWVEFPVENQVAESLVCVGPGANFAARSTLVLPKDKQGQLWSTLDTGRPGSRMTVGSFYPGVWLGNEQRGLLWWADNDRGWLPADDVPAHTVSRDDRGTVLRNHIVAHPATLNEPRTLQFSVMASPFRPLPDGWRATIASRDGTFLGPHKVGPDPTTGQEVNAWYCLQPPAMNPADWSEVWSTNKLQADKRIADLQRTDPQWSRSMAYVHTSVPLIGYPHTFEDDVYEYFRPTWNSNRYYNFSETHSDYLLSLIERNITEGGVRTFYWDLVFPTVMPATLSSVQAGVAYRLPDGRIQPGYFGFAMRRFMMRLNALLQDNGLHPGGNTVHSTNALLLVTLPWTDAVLDGEFHTILDSSAHDWVDGWPIDRMRAMSTGENFGVVFSWMDSIRVSDPDRAGALRQQQFEYIRLFDSWSTHNYQLVGNRALEWGLNRADVQFIPFWRNPYVQTDADTLVSMWRLPDRVMLAVFNMSEQQRDLELHVDLAALGLEPERAWTQFLRVEAMDTDPRFAPRDLYRNDLVPDAPEAWRQPLKTDMAEGLIQLPGVLGHRGRFVSIARY